MAKKTRLTIVDEIKTEVLNDKTFEEMINTISKYIIKNYRLKKIITITEIKKG